MRAGSAAGNFKARVGKSSASLDNVVSAAAEYAPLQQTGAAAAEAGNAATDLLRESSVQLTNSKFDRAELFMASLKSDELQPKGMVAKNVALCLRYGVRPAIIVTGWYIKIGIKVYTFYQKLPLNYMQMVYGLGLCFAGGSFFATLAAMEAAKQFGGQALLDELALIWEQAQVAEKASAADDKVDADNDGVADVQQIDPGALVNRKAKVCMAAVEDPERLVNALQFLFSAWMSVIATLKFRFAQYVAIALGLADMISLPVTRVLGYPIAMMMGEDLKHWVPTIITTIIKIICVSLVTFLVSVREGFYSGLRGGSLFAEGLINELGARGVMDKVPAWVPEVMVSRPYNADLSYLDEFIGWPLAAAGFIYQLMNGFVLEFPYNLMLFPLVIFEWVLRFNVFT
jgi:hypothetical protein